MLTELYVSGLGVITESRVVVPPGLVALTGETGAGKTLMVEAIDLLLGGRADSALVGPEADEAVVEGRFVIDDDEVVLTRVLPRHGRSRAYVNGRLATATALTERGRSLVDLHGQHAYQSLLAREHQRHAIDRFGGIDLTALHQARSELVAIEAELASLGGDERARRREIDLLRFQIAEIDAAAITGPVEDTVLEGHHDLLSSAVEHRRAGWTAMTALRDDQGALDALAAARAALMGRGPFDDIARRLETFRAELDDLADDLRRVTESIDEDPHRLAQVTERLNLLGDLRRKYGENLGEVLAFVAEQRDRLDRLESYEQRSRELEQRRGDALAAVAHAELEVGRRRRHAAPELARAVTATFGALALGHAELLGMCAPESQDPGGDSASFWFRPAPAMSAQPLSRIASGGELARTMLALRLVLTEGPPTLVFDEVDAGIGGTAARAVAEALHEVAQRHQVLVVTHLAQVAACADAHLVVEKSLVGGRADATVSVVNGSARVLEVARMLAGGDPTPRALEHAREVLGARIDDSSPGSG